MSRNWRIEQQLSSNLNNPLNTILPLVSMKSYIPGLDVVIVVSSVTECSH